MKYWNRLKKRLLLINEKLNQRGQSIVEFVLLLLVISTISFAFVALMNRNLALYWEHSANLIINDNPNVKTVTLE